jgi:hypothetical protein
MEAAFQAIREKMHLIDVDADKIDAAILGQLVVCFICFTPFYSALRLYGEV